MIAAVLLALALLGAWQAYVDLGGVDAFLLPAPTQIASSLWHDRGLLWSNFTVTAEEVALGLLVALVAALACALAIHLSATLRRTVLPLLVASQTIPVAIVAPLLVFWFGFGTAPKTAIVALVTFFPIVVTTLDGLAAVDPALGKLLRTMGASRWQALRHVEAPSALPALLSGAKIAVAVAVIGAVLAEQSGASAGLGHLITQGTAEFETARSYAAVVLLSAFAIALFAALGLAERRLAPWAHRSPPTGGTPR
jgi:ABC-type nitrate/sulfonate/bicarbonate transport system permease component